MTPARLTFVDVETTGMSPQHDRVIEVGILRVEDGEVVAQYNKLLNPETYIHPSIQSLTGISPVELEKAPTFAEEKDEIYELLADSVFVAHNVRFDYAFLKGEFSRFEMPFTSKQLCTARLSRLLFPNERRHGLTALIERFGFTCERRHRAFDDAHVLWQFYQRLRDDMQPEKLSEALAQVLKRPSLPPNLDPEILDRLPESPGVYEFYDKDQALLYVGKAIDVRTRVLSHFADCTSTKELSLSRQVTDIKVIPTAGELGALIRESYLVKTEQPIYNRQLRRMRQLILLKKTTTLEGFDTVKLETTSDINAHELENIMGMFKSKKQATTFLEFICEKYNLCKAILKLEHVVAPSYGAERKARKVRATAKPMIRKSCFGYHLGTCKGACRGEEKAIKYNMRFLLAFAENRIKPWYFEKPIEIIETSRETGRTERFVLDKWCILRTEEVEEDIVRAESENSLGDQDFSLPVGGSKNNETEYIFDIDTYKIIARYLNHYYFKKRYKDGVSVTIKTI